MNTKNLLIITQKVDEDDDLLGSFIDWLNEFAKNFAKIYIITLAVGKYNLPENVRVYSLGKEFSSGRLSRFLKFYFYVFKFMPRVDGVFAHMSPIFAIAAWPAAFIFRKKIILWYLHRSLTFKLKLAEKLSYKIVTAAKESLNLKSGKIIELGHGINFEKFKPLKKEIFNNTPVKILTVSRISKIKNLENLLEAAALIKKNGVNFVLEIIGRPIMPGDFEYFDFLKNLASRLSISGLVKFVGFVPYSQIPQYYQGADIFVNLAPKGGIDKAVLEAIAAGCLPLVANEVFARYFGDYAGDLIFKYRDPQDLAEKITKLLKSDSTSRISGYLRPRIIEKHNYKNLIKNIAKLYD